MKQSAIPPRLSESTMVFLRRVQQQVGNEKPIPDLGFHLESTDCLESYQVVIYPSGQVIYHFLRNKPGKKGVVTCRRFISRIETGPEKAHVILHKSLSAKLARGSAKRGNSSGQIPLID
jgi:hypothetical protein